MLSQGFMVNESTEKFKIEKDILKLEIRLREEIKSWPVITSDNRFIWIWDKSHFIN